MSETTTKIERRGDGRRPARLAASRWAVARDERAPRPSPAGCSWRSWWWSSTARCSILALFSFNDSIVIALPFKGFTLEWYREALQNPLVRESLKNSLAVALVVTPSR